MDASDRSAERLSTGLIEAGWLVAVAVVPLFFNPFTNRSFEPDKIAALQVLVLVMAGAWLVTVGLKGKRSDDDPTGRLPLAVLLPATAVGASAVLSSNLSVDPQLSWWGSYLRGQGTLTLLSLIAVFLLAAGHLRRVVQWRRAMFVVILTSVAVSLYALMQGAGTDPLSWSAGFRRSSSTLGNPIFLGGYLLMAIFMTVRQLADQVVGLIRSSGDTATRSRSLSAGVVGVGFLLFAVSIQVVALVRSGSRGPLLGLVAGLFVLALISALQLAAAIADDAGRPTSIRTAARWSWLGVIVAGLGAVAILVAAGRSAEPVRPEPAPARLARTFDAESRSARVRINLWAAVLEMMGSSEPLPLLPDVADPRHRARPLVGYGPETLQLSLNRFIPEELVGLARRGSVPDRAHNAALDQLATTGLVGLFSWLWLMAAVLSWGVRGLLPRITSRQRSLFWLVAGASVPLAVAASVAASGSWLWAGLAAPAALLLAAVTYVAFALRAAGRRGGSEIATGPGAAISAILMATVSAHLVEISFSFTTAATSLHFWFFAAVAAGVGLGRLQSDNDERSDRPERGAALSAALITAIVCCTLLLPPPRGPPTRPVLLLPSRGWSLLDLRPDPGDDHRPFHETARPGRWILVFSLVSAIPTVAFAALLRLRLEAASAADSVLMVERLSWLPVQFNWFLLVGATALAAAIWTRGRSPGGRRVRLAAIALGAVVALSGLAVPTILGTVRADVFAKAAGSAIDRQQPVLALDLANRAVKLAPLQDAFSALEARAAMAADGIGDGRSAGALELGEQGMVRAVELRPLDPDHVANLARLRVVLSERQSSAERRAWLEAQAGAGFERALQLRPGSAEFLAGLGGLMLRRGDLADAVEALAEAVRRDGRYVPAVLALAQCHQAMAEEATSVSAHDLALRHLGKARRALEEGLRFNPDSESLRSALAALPPTPFGP